MAALIDLMGGKKAFVRRLSYFHESGIVDISDEQSFLTIFQYHYAGRPGLSSKQVHHLGETVYDNCTRILRRDTSIESDQGSLSIQQFV